MYVTGSDAWNSQKQMSEVRIGGKARANCGRVYPTRNGAATNGGACFGSGKRDFHFQRAEPFAYSGPAPIFGS
jgi:hypothetical protein